MSQTRITSRSGLCFVEGVMMCLILGLSEYDLDGNLQHIWQMVVVAY